MTFEVWHCFLAGAMILLMGIDFITTEHAFASFPCEEMNPSPVMQYLAGRPLLHFIAKSIAVGVAAGVLLDYPQGWLGYVGSLVLLLLACLVIGSVQMSNIYQIFIKESPTEKEHP